MQYELIQDFFSLQQLCEQYSNAEFLAIDTEFVRTRTLYPKLGLLQVFDGKTLALIDPVAIDDLSPFWQLLTDKNIVKVLHACSEDLEVFLTSANCQPVNLIDSQIMMSFLGHGLSMGYAAMIQHFTGIELDKSESRTDWTKRPLSAKQLRYAEADVEYLIQVFPKILALLDKTNWLEAARQDTQLMIDKKFTPIDEGNLYQQVKMSWKLNTKQLNALKYLATWRYQRAKQRDLPLGFVVKDHTLIAVAKANPNNVGVMAGLEGAEVLDIRHQGKAMLTVLKKANAVEPSHYPEKIVRLDEYPGYKQIFKSVKNFVLEEAELCGLAVENLASKKQINQFLTCFLKFNNSDLNPENIEVLQGWRLTVFGEKLQKFAENKFKR